MKERGSAMLTAVIATMVLLLISGIISSVIIYQFKLESTEDKGLKTLYIAEAGINYGVYSVRNDPNTFFQETYISASTHLYETPINIPTITNPFGPAYGGVFDVYVQTYYDPISYIFTVTSTGYYPDQTGIKRTIEQQYTFLR